MAKSPLAEVLSNLCDYLSEHKVASSEELKVRIAEGVAGLDGAERLRLEEDLGGDLEEEVFKSITEGTRISVFSPDLHVKLNYLGEMFHCPPSHSYMADELRKAFLRLVRIRSPRVMGAVNEILSGFLEEAGYEVRRGESGVAGVDEEILATKGEYRLCLYLMPSIVLLADCLAELETLAEEEQVFVVPAERTPAPFITFFRENREVVDFVKYEGMLMWVVDYVNGAINPFIGRPGDEAVWRNFRSPEQSLMAAELWMQGV
ncbi:hypothetical protein ACFLX5_02930 [Chloroflexota bacterium]